MPSTHAQPAAAESNASEEVLGITSLARALGGEASLPDVGALSWMMFKQVLPCSAMGLFVPDEASDTVVGCYAAGHHAGMIRGLQSSPGDGIVGWVAGHRRPAVNAEPALDFGLGSRAMDPPLLSALAIPLVHDGTLVAVLSLYATTPRDSFFRGPRATTGTDGAEAGGLNRICRQPRRNRRRDAQGHSLAAADRARFDVAQTHDARRKPPRDGLSPIPFLGLGA